MAPVARKNKRKVISRDLRRFTRVQSRAISRAQDDVYGAADKHGGGGSVLGLGGGGGSGGLGDLFSSAHAIQGRRRQAAYSREREDMVRESELMFNQVYIFIHYTRV